MLENSPVVDGVTFFEYIRGGRSRRDLSRDPQVVEKAIAAVYNDPTMDWSLYSAYRPCQQFNPTSLAHIRLPRNPVDILKHFKKDLLEQVKSFVSAFKQSGRGNIDDWDWERFPVAELLFRVHPDLLQLAVGAVISSQSEMILSGESFQLGVPVIDDAINIRDSDDDSGESISDEETTEIGELQENRVSGNNGQYDDVSLASFNSNESHKRRRSLKSLTLEDIASFVANKGSLEKKPRKSGKRPRLSDSQMKLTLATYQAVSASNVNMEIANSIARLADAIKGFSEDI